MKNVVLIGMPGAGKSTIGVLLAKSRVMDFCDTDLIIQKVTGKSLSEIINEDGIDAFIELEEKIICDQNIQSSVIATGGSAVYGEIAMDKLKENGVIIYLKVSPGELCKRINNIHTRGIAMKAGTTIPQLYEERAPLYEKYADITILCDNLSPEECVEKIIKNI